MISAYGSSGGPTSPLPGSSRARPSLLCPGATLDEVHDVAPAPVRRGRGGRHQDRERLVPVPGDAAGEHQFLEVRQTRGVRYRELPTLGPRSREDLCVLRSLQAPRGRRLLLEGLRYPHRHRHLRRRARVLGRVHAAINELQCPERGPRLRAAAFGAPRPIPRPPGWRTPALRVRTTPRRGPSTRPAHCPPDHLQARVVLLPLDVAERAVLDPQFVGQFLAIKVPLGAQYPFRSTPTPWRGRVEVIYL